MGQMGKKDKQGKRRRNHVKADVIILGCSLPGIVTAHNLKKKFGNSMDIVVLDLAASSHTLRATPSRCAVAFTDCQTLKPEHDHEVKERRSSVFIAEPPPEDIPKLYNSVARYYLTKYAKDFKIALPDAIIAPETVQLPLNKLFQYRNGSIVNCKQTNFHDFKYLSFVERFELEQYQGLLDSRMHHVFEVHTVDSEAERKQLRSYDQTTMEDDICSRLFFTTSREIMRTIVRLVCGTNADKVSVLFYLHQCYRSHGSKNQVDGNNTRFCEKILGYARKRLTFNLLQSIADITLPSKPIREIRTYADEQVILEPEGETDYICNLLAMALRPDELNEIQLEKRLVTDKDTLAASKMVSGTAKKFMVRYDNSFWRQSGYSGDIFSVRGPIVWAMERPELTNTGKEAKKGEERTAALVGYLKVKDPKVESKEAVLEQLVKLFGEEAATPLLYKETEIKDIFVPHRGDYVALRKITTGDPHLLEWAALDIFADGDTAAAIEAGHTAYLHLLSCLRPQAVTYEDVAYGAWPVNLDTFGRLTTSINIMNGTRIVAIGIGLIVGITLLRRFLSKSSAD